jgi:ABC-type uncharacterized transport system ATPase subunit
MDEKVKNLKYNYDNKKIISVRYSEPTQIEIENVNIIASSGHGVKVEVDTERAELDSVVAYLFKAGKVEDISISSRPLEDIIAEVYSQKEVKEIEKVF